jgi:peptidyl-prolyl cis-trans isomerase SurA
MMFPQFRQSMATLLVAASVSAVPALAAPDNAKVPDNAGLPAPPQGRVVEEIVARVNDQIITQSDYNRAAEQLNAEASQQGVPSAELALKKNDLLRDLIDKQLLLSKGKELGITGETDLIKELDNLRKQNHLDSLEDLEKAAQQQGVSFEDFKASIRDRIITQQVVRDEVGRRISMTPAEVQQYFKAHESEFAQPESVTLNEILIPTPAKAASEEASAPDVAAAQAKADAITAKLASGAKFADLAKASPADPNDPKLVALGEYHRGQLAKEIEDKAFSLQAGQSTQPIRTKQGYIILQAEQHNPGGDASFKQVEPQVEEALFMERMTPKLREYLTQLREEAAIDIKPGMVDSGASGNEMRLTYTAYTPPAEKTKKKFARKRFRGRTNPATAETAKTTTPAAGAAAPAATAPGQAAAGQTAAGSSTAGQGATAPGQPAAAPAAGGANALANGATPANPAAANAQPATQQASKNEPAVEKPGKREKIRFGQAPRESLPKSEVASADNGAGSVTTPENRYVNPDGTISNTAPVQTERKTRLANRPAVKKVKKENEDKPDADEQATQKVQQSGLGLTDPNAVPKPKEKAEKTRMSDRKPEPAVVQQPYLGKPEPNNQQPPAGGMQQTQTPAGSPSANPSPTNQTPPQ